MAEDAVELVMPKSSPAASLEDGVSGATLDSGAPEAASAEITAEDQLVAEDTVEAGLPKPSPAAPEEGDGSSPTSEPEVPPAPDASEQRPGAQSVTLKGSTASLKGLSTSAAVMRAWPVPQRLNKAELHSL